MSLGVKIKNNSDGHGSGVEVFLQQPGLVKGLETEEGDPMVVRESETIALLLDGSSRLQDMSQDYLHDNVSRCERY